MNATQLYEFLYDWATGVLPSVEVRQSHQDYPTPKQTPFLVLSYSGDWVNKGAAPSRMIWDRPDLPSPRVYQWRGQLTIYEVEGNGELLHQLVESLDSIDVKNSFGEAGLSVLRSIGPQMQPALQDSNWKYEAILILELSWARAITGSLEVIESVEISGTIQNSKSDPDGEKNRYILIEGEKSEDVSTTP
jgi:CDP-glycerol glycerophosphotransferase (TagB/SpsB family)